MSIVFYDLETTDANFLGQILKFEFVEIDEKDWSERSSISGTVKINRLQLPAPDAILSNKIDVIKHQKEYDYTEQKAAKTIYEYLDDVVGESDGRVYLTGYGSSSFDIHYLRTLLVRYGFNPYFSYGNSLEYRDLRHVLWKLYLDKKIKPETGNKLQGIEDACLALGIKYQEKVKSQIAITKFVEKKYNINLCKFSSYDGWKLEDSGEVYNHLIPFGDSCPVIYLQGNHSKCWWVNLDKFRDKDYQSSIIYVNKRATPFFLGKKITDKATIKLAEKTLKTLERYDPSEMFQDIDCDIEQHIYRIPFNAFDMINEAIWEDNKELVAEYNNPDVTTLVKRVCLAKHKWKSKDPANSESQLDHYMLSLLKKYANYRYGGKCSISKRDSEFQTDGMHPTLQSYVEMSNPDNFEKASDKTLMKSLRKFYKESDILKYGMIDCKI